MQCTELAQKLAEDMAEEGLRGKTLTLKLKATNFEVRTRAVTLQQPVSTAQEILQAALRLLRAEMPIEIRLMGIRVSSFVEVHAMHALSTVVSFCQPACLLMHTAVTIWSVIPPLGLKASPNSSLSAQQQEVCSACCACFEQRTLWRSVDTHQTVPALGCGGA